MFLLLSVIQVLIFKMFIQNIFFNVENIVVSSTEIVFDDHAFYPQMTICNAIPYSKNAMEGIIIIFIFIQCFLLWYGKAGKCCEPWNAQKSCFRLGFFTNVFLKVKFLCNYFINLNESKVMLSELNSISLIKRFCPI